MPRRRKSIVLSLFPFLSILVCVIGTLTLIITGQALGIRDDQSRAVRWQSIPTNMQSESFEAVVTQADALERDLGALRDVLRELGLPPGEAETETRVVQLLRELQSRLAELSHLRYELQVVRKEIKKTQEAINALRLGPKLIGSGTDLVPRFVECTKDGIVVDADRDPPQRFKVPFESIKRSARFKEVLRDVRGTKKATVTFLVRPGGVKSFDAAESTADRLKAHNGHVPIPGTAPIDFTQSRSR